VWPACGDNDLEVRIAIRWESGTVLVRRPWRQQAEAQVVSVGLVGVALEARQLEALEEVDQ